jgi:hypothetical protein
MCCFVEIGMLIMGVMALVQGKVKLWSRIGVVHGTPARLAGAVMILPMIIALAAVVLLGANMAAQGKQELGVEEQRIARFIEPVATIACLVIATVILVVGKDTAGPRSSGEDEEPGRWKYDE